MRILMLQNSLPPYWIARLKAITEQPDVEITLATNSGGDKGRPDEAFQGLKLKWVPLSQDPIEDVNFVKLIPKTLALLRSTMPDVAYLAGIMHSNFLAAHVACKMMGIPIIGSSISTDFDARGPEGIGRQVKEAIKKTVLSMVDIMLVPGQRAYQHMQRFGLGEDRLMLAGHASATPEYREKSLALSEQELAQRLETLGMPEPGYFLFVGRFTWVKNIPRLLKAYAKASEECALPRLVLVGDGPDRADIETLVMDLNLSERVLLAGYKNAEELLYAFAGARALVLPSVSETWGMVVNEAMACGVPALVSERAGCAPDLIDEGQTGWLVDPESEESIARALVAAAADKTSKLEMRERLWEKVRHHSPTRFAETFVRAARTAAFRHGRLEGEP
ncbi:MAG: glycosyltransferase [Planctomycetes bacterium]|nr:glycosyltransferase [Planctomycetota bacterium]